MIRLFAVSPEKFVVGGYHRLDFLASENALDAIAINLEHYHLSTKEAQQTAEGTAGIETAGRISNALDVFTEETFSTCDVLAIGKAVSGQGAVILNNSGGIFSHQFLFGTGIIGQEVDITVALKKEIVKVADDTCGNFGVCN
ncbi:hypothetical protein BMS3Bbin04_00457 [bacterium BMS3Bbin04]|nr:hypothetical protein BMS3Bbin04_00457 [bacterium BMS3Bbin04]